MKPRGKDYDMIGYLQMLRAYPDTEKQNVRLWSITNFGSIRQQSFAPMCVHNALRPLFLFLFCWQLAIAHRQMCVSPNLVVLGLLLLVSSVLLVNAQGFLSELPPCAQMCANTELVTSGCLLYVL